MIPLELLKISAIGGILFLDSAPLGQWMISQPIIAGPIIGWFLGDPISGFIIGGLLQLFWTGRLPIGTSCPPEQSISVMVSVIIYISIIYGMGMESRPEWMIYAISIGLGAGIWGGKMTVFIRGLNNKFSNLAQQYVQENQYRYTRFIPFYSIGLIWITATLFIFLSSSLALLLFGKIYDFIPMISLWNYYPWILISIGIAVILELFHLEKRIKLLLFGLLSGYGLGLLKSIILG